MNDWTQEKCKGDEKREEILFFIICYIKEHGYPPTIREIGDNVGLKSSSSVHWHLMSMIEKGILETDAPLGSSRAIRVPGFRFMKG